MKKSVPFVMKKHVLNIILLVVFPALEIYLATLGSCGVAVAIFIALVGGVVAYYQSSNKEKEIKKLQNELSEIGPIPIEDIESICQ